MRAMTTVAAGIYCTVSLGTVLYSARQMVRRNTELANLAAIKRELAEAINLREEAERNLAESRHSMVIEWFQKLDEKLDKKSLSDPSNRTEHPLC